MRLSTNDLVIRGREHLDDLNQDVRLEHVGELMRFLIQPSEGFSSIAETQNKLVNPLSLMLTHHHMH